MTKRTPEEIKIKSQRSEFGDGSFVLLGPFLSIYLESGGVHYRLQCSGYSPPSPQIESHASAAGGGRGVGG